MNEVKIAIIDGSEFFRIGLKEKLSSQSDFRLIDCAPDQEPLKFVDANSFDVVLLDIDYPESAGLHVARTIARHYPNTKVIVLTAHFNDDELFETIKTGAIAYFDKRGHTEELVNAIRKASRGEYPINDSLYSRPAVVHRVLTQFQQMASMGFVVKDLAAPLTGREIQILNYVANGNTNKQVADLLGISDQTIKNHVSAILRKLNANDRAHAVAMAVHNQWVSLDPR